ncbi:substrate-binding periplasmic protein [Rhizobium sp. C1]|uniref:substrate-binding periplasmic protein n=1 Tax=Rhizobium sp. C1 TaxID=1349799 RepID=UPI001E517931|nr:transporter substrate-binding domain-containing protein [Rhizobium sp. C1]MCD2176362.1 transporter substrate-binding domain-containing protein [Rhizobium sp. C1]
MPDTTAASLARHVLRHGLVKALLGAHLSLLAAGLARAENIRFVTETYPPFNYLENGQVRGASADQIKLIMKEVDIPFSIEVMPWARAISEAETGNGVCLFTAVHNPERDHRFKWVEPLLRSRTILIHKTGSKAAPKTLDEAKSYIVGTQRGDFTEDLLTENKFPKVDLATDLVLTFKKLMSGRIDLMPMSEKYYDQLKRDGADIESVITLSESTYSIACNRNTKDSMILRLQQVLNNLIAEGTQRRILDTYGVASDEKTSQ